MGSTYGYITVAELEAFTGINYETTFATYVDAFVEAQITLAEMTYNTMCVQAPGATDAAKVATFILAERYMRNVMFVDGYAEEAPQSTKVFFDYLINIMAKADKYMPSGIVPMSGAER